jgi:hypothetical protein
MSEVDYFDVVSILETIYNTDDIEVIYFEQSTNFVFIDALIDGKAIQMTIDAKKKEVLTAAITHEKKGAG